MPHRQARHELTAAGEARCGDGLLTNDSPTIATTRPPELPRIASADADSGSLEGLVLHRPADLQ